MVKPAGPNSWGAVQISVFVYEVVEHVCAISGKDATTASEKTTKARTFMALPPELSIVLFDDPFPLNPS
jgi:hypothetical protein